ncbi:MAG: hypothetical protein HQM08_02640 [Candidatus Riflebacteria bacterium]|nr:hypothetical protein [Candidatus Riflebacteria bacterium]
MLVFLFSMGVIFAEDTPKPWEDPNAGFSGTWTSTNSGTTPSDAPTSGGVISPGTPTGNDSGYDKIDKVIKSTGATTVDGKVVSNSGIDKGKSGTSHEGFVDGFLNDAASKISGTSGSAWAWSWSKSWKIGPDGKPEEVRQSYQQGELNFNGSNNPKPTDTPSTPAPAAPSTPTVPTTPSTPANPTANNPEAPAPTTPAATPQAPAPTTPAVPPANPTTASNQPTPVTNPAPATPAAPPAPVVQAPPTKGVDAAPIKLPDPLLTLTIRDPLSDSEQPPIPTSFSPSDVVNTVPPEALSRIATAVPEQTRVRFSFEPQPALDQDKIRVTFVDPNDPQENIPFQRNFFHVYRTPSDDKYWVKAYYPDPNTKDMQEVMSVRVPVYKMNFRNQTIQSNQSRGSDGAMNSDGSGNSDGNSTSQSGSNSQGTGNSGNNSNSGSLSNSNPSMSPSTSRPISTKSTSYPTISSSQSNESNFSDLYNDPANPTTISGAISTGNGQNPTGNSATRQGNNAVNNRHSSALGNHPAYANTVGRSSNDSQGSSSDGSNAGYSNTTGNSNSSNEANSNFTGAQSNRGTNNPGNRNSAGDQRTQNFGNNGSANSGNSGSSSSQSGGDSPSSSGMSTQLSVNSGSNSGSSGNSNISSGENYTSLGANSPANSDSTSDSPNNDVNLPDGNEKANTIQAANAQGQVTTSQNSNPTKSNENEKSCLLNLIMKCPSDPNGQTFDFINDSYPTASPVTANSDVSFSLSIAKDIKPEAINIIVFDGKEKITVSAKTLVSDSFRHKFANPTAEAYIWIYGDNSGKSFSYKVSFPVNAS